MITIPLDDYNKLLTENQYLHNKLNDLTAFNNTLIKIIEHKDKTIEELKRENEELKARIAYLEKELISTKQELATTKQELATTKQELATVRDDFNTFKSNTLNNILYKKIIMGLQDYNAIEMLETKLEDSSELESLREDRVDECHYINKKLKPTTQEKDIKINILIEKINNAPIKVLDKFNNMYPSLLEQLKPFLVHRDVEPNEKITKRANAWWD